MVSRTSFAQSTCIKEFLTLINRFCAVTHLNAEGGQILFQCLIFCVLCAGSSFDDIFFFRWKFELKPFLSVVYCSCDL